MDPVLRLLNAIAPISTTRHAALMPKRAPGLLRML